MRNFKYIFSVIAVLQLLLLFQSANTLASENCLKSNYQNVYNNGSSRPNNIKDLHSLPAENSHLNFDCAEKSNPTNNSIFIETEEQIPDEKIIHNCMNGIFRKEFVLQNQCNNDLSDFEKDFGFINYNKLLGRFIRD
jgi:hypothetical protein